MLSLMTQFAGNTIAAPFIFIILFLVIGGAALWLTPRIAAWLDKKDAAHKSYYDGMLEEDPNKEPPHEDVHDKGDNTCSK